MFENKVVIITGGAGVIGKEIAKAFLTNKAVVVILGITALENKQAVTELKSVSDKIFSYAADVLDKEGLQSIRKVIEKKHGICDILVNAAGGNNKKSTTDDEYFDSKMPANQTFFTMEETAFKQNIDLNLLGTVLPSQVFGESMSKRGRGNIINISSMNAYIPLTKIPAYSSAKAAINNFTQWLATYLAKSNVRVNAIAPGFLLTNQNKALLQNENGQFNARANKVIAGTPMGRFGEPSELVGALLFLADDQLASFITGVILPIDGGFSSYSGV